MTLREDYGVPKRSPASLRMFAVMLGFVGLALAVGALAASSAILVAVAFVVLAAAVAVGVFTVLSSRRLREPPR